ncbi:MAG: zinc-dependent metalloprotease [Gemmatimonadota bacterium]|nr:MAG: zinc-dependent metalloprotease [Gemmatimonadota bacterium]
MSVHGALEARLLSTRASACVLGVVTLLAAVPAGSAALPQRDEVPTIESKTRGMAQFVGFFDLYWDESEGRLYWEIDRWNTEFLYQVSLSTGLGSNPVGLDRGQLGGTYILKAQRVGPTVLLVEPNYGYRARSDNPDEVRAVEEAFAPSTHWGFEVLAETGDRVLVDASDFFLRDAHGVAQRLERTGQGNYRLDRSRSVFYLPRTRAFPLNTEVETSLTFASDLPGPLVRSTAASGSAVTLRQHHSLVQLPGDGYEPRAVDSRVGAFGVSFHDYAAAIDMPLEVRWVARHRLQKKNPQSARSEPLAPIVYYLDRGVPEPIRSALLEGAAWWNAAFEEAGFVDGFRVEMLPEGADPMDLRYNMIHWTHRSTRGWSYGGSVVDPRTGEIVKGNVNLGSLRVRQDHLLGRGLVSPFDASIAECDLAGGPTFDYLATVAEGSDPAEMALARIRQLSAHEVGHTLGLSHNYIASTQGRASVMDYPAPLVTIAANGSLDLSDAYSVGMGEYDKFVIKWLYSEFAPGVDEEAALDAIVQDGLQRGVRFITDRDARPAGAAHPLAALWDNGSDPVAALEHEIAVRRIGLENFGATAIRLGEPMAALEEVLVPLYLHHRYQVEATAHSLGGADYSFALRGDGQTPIEIVPGVKQRRALDAMLLTIEPEFLAIPERILQLIPPRAFGMSGGEIFEKHTAPTFDPLGVAASAADLTFELILQTERMARLVEFHVRDESYPGLAEVVDRTFEVTWYAPPEETPYIQEIRHAVERVLLDRLLAEAGSARNTPQVRAVLTAQVGNLAAWLAELESPTHHQRLALEDINRWWQRDEGATGPTEPAALPPGSPIGERR